MIKISKFAEKFWTPYSQITTLEGKELKRNEVIGKKFIIIGEKDKNSYDFEEVGVMYIVEIDGGIVTEAYPEEVEKEEQQRQIAIHGY